MIIYTVLHLDPQAPDVTHNIVARASVSIGFTQTCTLGRLPHLFVAGCTFYIHTGGIIVTRTRDVSY